MTFFATRYYRANLLINIKLISKSMMCWFSGFYFLFWVLFLKNESLVNGRFLVRGGHSEICSKTNWAGAERLSEDNLPLQVEEIILDDTQCQQNTRFIKILLDDIISNALCSLGKSSDETKITTRHTNEMSTFVQQSTSDDTLTPTTNDIHAPITKNYYASISASSFDEGFQN